MRLKTIFKPCVNYHIHQGFLLPKDIREIFVGPDFKRKNGNCLILN
jgi:hypothetical protein